VSRGAGAARLMPTMCLFWNEMRWPCCRPSMCFTLPTICAAWRRVRPARPCQTCGSALAGAERRAPGGTLPKMVSVSSSRASTETLGATRPRRVSKGQARAPGGAGRAVWRQGAPEVLPVGKPDFDELLGVQELELLLGGQRQVLRRAVVRKVCRSAYRHSARVKLNRNQAESEQEGVPPRGCAHPPRASVGSIFLNFDGSAAHTDGSTHSWSSAATPAQLVLQADRAVHAAQQVLKLMVGSALFARTLRCCTHRGCQCEQLPSEASMTGHHSQPSDKRHTAAAWHLQVLLHHVSAAGGRSWSTRGPGASAELLSGVLIDVYRLVWVSRQAPGLLCCAAKLGRVMAGLHACRAAALGCLLIDRPGSASHTQCVFKAWGAWAHQSRYPQGAPRSDAAPERGACAGPTRPGGAPCPGRGAPCCCRPASGGRGARAASA